MFVKVANILNLYPMVHSGTFHAYGFAPFSRGEKRLFSRVFGRFVNDPMSHSKAYRCRVTPKENSRDIEIVEIQNRVEIEHHAIHDLDSPLRLELNVHWMLTECSLNVH